MPDHRNCVHGCGCTMSISVWFHLCFAVDFLWPSSLNYCNSWLWNTCPTVISCKVCMTQGQDLGLILTDKLDSFAFLLLRTHRWRRILVEPALNGRRSREWNHVILSALTELSLYSGLTSLLGLCIKSYNTSGNFRTLGYSLGYSLVHSPHIGLIYCRYLQFRFPIDRNVIVAVSVSLPPMRIPPMSISSRGHLSGVSSTWACCCTEFSDIFCVFASWAVRVWDLDCCRPCDGPFNETRACSHAGRKEIRALGLNRFAIWATWSGWDCNMCMLFQRFLQLETWIPTHICLDCGCGFNLEWTLGMLSRMELCSALDLFGNA